MNGPHARCFLNVRDRLVERHFSVRAQIADGERRRAIESRVAMKIDSLTACNQGMEIVDRDSQPLTHRVGAPVLDRGADERNTVGVAFGAHRLKVKAVQPQIVVILKVVHRSDAMGILQPSDVVRAGIFADEQLAGDFGK